jgi:hypothetical protein
VPEECTVLIASPELLPALKQRAADANGAGELLAFTDADALRALDVITKRRPSVVALERLFAATPRGAALINRIKADPSLVESEIRVVSPDSEYTRVSPRRTAPAEPTDGAAAGGSPTAATSVAAPAAAPAPPLDQRGTRRAPRFKVAGSVGVLVDGNAATLVDISTVGAQVVTSAVLKPNQRIRMALTDAAGAIRFNASVAWAKFEIPPKSGPRYRAGLEFIDANAPAVDAYCSRHKA